ncbi:MULTISPECIES: ATP-binding cassette domain-containing protein [Enterococcus]|uniref:ATP-binding cassette domain-containing protein n=1 Tax=Enterococcus TaxID=1350 RepID=UPI00189961EA|nr:ABC transporter ATP-binding protein [Enterococcus mundtii]MBO1085123.1 ABC transporter ATP-binding protein [Enterococcus mundtii]MDV7743564.1 ABC transporter ATP-binding protein [Enterococcus mundtii]
MIELINLGKQYKQKILFQDVNVIFNEGKKSFIKGINGSGKSVLMKLIVGYSTPTKGMVKVAGKIIGVDQDFIPDAGVFINAPDFIKSWTGAENLLYLANIRKVANEKKIRFLASQLNLEKDLNKKYKYYSLGMKQKLRIIQALMDEPTYLILDEPFDALDKNSRENVLDLLDNYLSEDAQRILIFSSHNDMMEDFADHIYELENQTLLQIK